MNQPTYTVPAQYAVHIDVRSDTGCWEWCGSRWANGYASISVDGRRVLGHRHFYELFVGPIHNVINHRCEVKWCVNPAHLEDVTQRENVHYSVKRWGCKVGHTDEEADWWVSPTTGKRRCRKCDRERAHDRYVAAVGHETKPRKRPTIYKGER